MELGTEPVGEIDTVRIRHWLATPARVWRSSLALRVVFSALMGSIFVMMVAGFFLLYSVTGGIVDNSRESASVDANEAMNEIEQQMRNAGYDYANSDALNSIVTAAIQRGNSSGRYQVFFVTAVGTFYAPSLDYSVIPTAIREATRIYPSLEHSVPTQLRFRDGSIGPGRVIAFGGGTDRDRYEVYFVFSFEQEARTLAMVRTAVGLTSLGVLIGIGLVAYAVARQTLGPLRMARRAAERLASGELTQLMSIRGTDDLAQLAMSMNHMATQLQQRIRQWEQLSRLQQRFVSDVSHELRTPLTTVRMAVDVIYDKRDTLPEVQRKSIELLNKELNRFEALLGQLLEISRFDAGAAVLDVEEHNIVDTVRSEMEALEDLATSAGCTLTLHSDQECTAMVDPRRISRLVRNLLSNAIEHGEGKPIDIYLAYDEDVVALAVRDHGVGFTLEEGKQLFNRFWRADPARARAIGGTGLGLSISQEDVRLHKGWIHAWGRPGLGAQFRVVLPRRENVIVAHSPIGLIPIDSPEGAS